MTKIYCDECGSETDDNGSLFILCGDCEEEAMTTKIHIIMDKVVLDLTEINNPVVAGCEPVTNFG